VDRPRDHVIKICGVRSVDIALAAGNAGATTIGFMLAPSKRQVTVARIREILGAMPGARPEAAAVMVNPSAGEVASAIDHAGVEIVQLSGDEDPSILDDLDTTVWKAVRFAPGTTVDDARRSIDPWLDHRRPVTNILVDAAVTGRYGGTGHRADWDLAAALAELYPLILAGGLKPGNVEDAIIAVRPLGVDVSSGVETDGAKDPPLIHDFVRISTKALHDGMPPAGS